MIQIEGFIAVAPISVNKAYTTGMHGQRVLTAEGVDFKAAVQAEVVSWTMDQCPNWQEVIEQVYTGGHVVNLVLDFHVAPKRLFNMSWKPGSQTPSGRPSAPLKMFDISNLIKLLEDAISSATGIDDSCTTALAAYKSVAGEQGEGVRIQYMVLSDDEFEHPRK